MQKKLIIVAFVLILATIVFATISPLQLRPPVIFTANIDRALAFFGLMMLGVIAFPQAWKYALAAAVTFPILLELLQSVSPTRHAEVMDAVIKATGGVLGCAAALTVLMLARHCRRRSDSAIREKRLLNFLATAKTTELAVQSKLIQSIHFSPVDGRLLVRFSDGRDGLFEGVTEPVAQALAEAKSPGQFYVQEFKPQVRRVA